MVLYKVPAAAAAAATASAMLRWSFLLAIHFIYELARRRPITHWSYNWQTGICRHGTGTVLRFAALNTCSHSFTALAVNVRACDRCVTLFEAISGETWGGIEGMGGN